MPKEEQIERKTFLVDVQGKILGRAAAKIAVILSGKHKPMYSVHIDTGDNVVVINAAQIRTTGRKLSQKVYRRYSGYPGGLRETTLEEMLEKKPAEVVSLAVKRMLPQSPLGRKMFKKLKVYAGNEHLHKAQKPILLEL